MNSSVPDWSFGFVANDKDISVRQALRVLSQRKNRLRKKIDHLLLNNPELVASETVQVIRHTEEVTACIDNIRKKLKSMEKIYMDRKNLKKNPVQNKMAGRNQLRVR